MSEAYLRKLFDDLGCFAGAGAAALNRLAACGSLTRYEAGATVFSDKDLVPKIYVAATGLVTLYKLNAQGDKKVFFVLKPGEMLNESIEDDLPASAHAEALEDTLLMTFDKKKFQAVMADDFGLTRAVMKGLSTKVRRLYRQLKNTTGSVRGSKRVAAKLWKLARDHGRQCDQGLKIDIRLTVTSLADLTGAKRETLSRQLKVLTGRGLIIMSEGYFIVPDPDRLAKFYQSR